ncbi:MAG: hypothetical protein QOJ91_1561 [Sphingomonadales bacterium]|jgi:hypothetical protein|nr:hypothetical protein [Sphingomonadales bacterium]
MDKKNPQRRSERPTGPAGAILRSHGKDGPQLVRSRGHRWTDEAEGVFLDCLAASNNATWAAEQCGFSTVAIYQRARRDPVFAEKMEAARSQAYGRIDEALARRAEDFLAGRPPDPESPIVDMTVQDAIAILKLHRAAQNPGGNARRPAWPARPKSLEEMRDSILRKLSAIARKRGLI